MLKSAPFSAWHSLPRETRDTFFLIAVIAWIILPLSPHIPIWTTVFAALLLTWRSWLSWRTRPLPSRWMLVLLLAITFGATFATHHSIVGRDAGVTLVVILLVLKTLELRAKRDAFVVFFLGFFTLLANFLFSQSLLTAICILMALLGLLTALVNAHMLVGKPALLQSAKIAGRMALLGTPIMVALFVFFPRFAPLWGMPGSEPQGRSGLSERMSVGTIAALALDESVAMRIKFGTLDNQIPAQHQMYFRGPVLGHFTGREWLPVSEQNYSDLYKAAPTLKVQGEPLRYEITLEPNNKSWIFAMDTVQKAPNIANFRMTLSPDLQLISNRPITEIVRYQVESYSQFNYGLENSARNLQIHTELPAQLNPRTLQLAREILANPANAGLDAVGLANLAIERLRTGGYSYTLEPGVYGINSADEFWFDRKEGFCEHIASAFAILLRAMHVPARIVTGYQGGERNPVDGLWTVRQSDAHAWTEIWQPEQGWIRIDPTSAVAPGRTGAFQRLPSPRGAFSNVMGNVINPNLIQTLRSVWEAVNNNWNQRILNYTQDAQFNLLKNLGFNKPSWTDLIMLLCGLLAMAALSAAGWTLWSRSQHDPWQRLLAQVIKRMQQQGINAAPISSPRQLAELLGQHFSPQSSPKAQRQLQALSQWLLQLEVCRYAKNPPLSVSQLSRTFKQLQWPNRESI